MKPFSPWRSVVGPIAYVTVIVLAACSNGSSRGPEVYGTATIGPEGGELAITDGPQAGLRLSVPAGALAAPTELRVVAVPVVPLPPNAAALGVEQPGIAFELQPVGLSLELQASLRAPYRVGGAPFGTSPYNVVVRRLLVGEWFDLEPTANDPAAQRVDVLIRTLGRYQVVRGRYAPGGIADYRPAVGTTVALSGGVTFAVEDVPPGTPFGGNAAQRWRISAPAEGTDDALYFDGVLLRGRESLASVANWREVWSEPYPLWVLAESGAPAQSLTTAMGVEAPIGGMPVGGTISIFGITSFAAPRTVAGQLFNDVVQTTIMLAWSRQDLGVGQRQYSFFFAPGVGLLGFTQDGLLHERTSL